MNDNDEKLVQHMIDFIEEKEREVQLEELKGSKAKTKVASKTEKEPKKTAKKTLETKGNTKKTVSQKTVKTTTAKK